LTRTPHGPPPDSLRDAFTNRLRKQRDKRAAWAKRHGVTCFRLYDQDLPDAPLQLDWYEGAVCASWLPAVAVHTDADNPHPWLEAMLDATADALGVPRSDIFPRLRLRRRNGWQYERLSRDHITRVVHEDGLRFEVNLTDFLDTGLFLDHRRARALVRAQSAGKHVLNLFAYTGAFSVHAAAGGALSTTSVDLSRAYLSWAQRNLALNALDAPAHRTLALDIWQLLDHPPLPLPATPRAPAPRSYDIIICDPPTFSTSDRSARDLDLQRDHAELLTRLRPLLSADGVLYFSTNARGLTLDLPALSALYACQEITSQTTSEDFRAHPLHRCWRMTPLP
jgi:23S rRNA G2069 N7-methylase RlmK/C1962 C5-methylase RlmI